MKHGLNKHIHTHIHTPQLCRYKYTLYLISIDHLYKIL